MSLTKFQKASKQVINYLEEFEPEIFDNLDNTSGNYWMSEDNENLDKETVLDFISRAIPMLESISSKSSIHLDQLDDLLNKYSNWQTLLQIIAALASAGTVITLFISEDNSAKIISILTLVVSIGTIITNRIIASPISGESKKKLARELVTCLGDSERIKSYLKLRQDLIKSRELLDKLSEEITQIVGKSSQLFKLLK